MAEALPDTPRAGWRAGLSVALGLQGFLMAATCLSFGALARASGLDFDFAVLATATMWAVPAQIVMTELLTAGTPFLAIIGAVAFTNARFTPMAVSLFPVLRGWGPRYAPFLAVHFIAVTPWAFTLRDAPRLPAVARLPFWLGLASTNFILGVLGTAAGYLLAVTLPPIAGLGLAFMVIAYWVIMCGDMRERPLAIAIAAGAMIGPGIHLVAPDWSLFIGGMTGGTIGYGVDRILRRSHA
jgi:predicted branched-subunit amino acid permease